MGENQEIKWQTLFCLPLFCLPSSVCYFSVCNSSVCYSSVCPLLFAPLLFATNPLLFATNASLSAPIKRPFYCEMMDQWLHNHHRGRWQPISGESIFSHISNPFWRFACKTRISCKERQRPLFVARLVGQWLYEIYGGVEFSMENAQIVASIVEYRGAGRGGAGPEGEGKG